MKAHYFILLNAVSFACFAQKSDEDAIKKVIQQETFSFFHKDYDAWANCWTHDNAAYVTWSGTTEHTQLIGWDAIAARFKQEMNIMAAPDEALIAPYLNKTDHRIFINGNTAIVSFKEGVTDPTFQTRSLIKQNGNWKILSSSLVVNHSYALMQTIGMLRSLVGTWEMQPGALKITPADGNDYKSLRFEITETPFGFELLEIANVVTSDGYSVNPPLDMQFFIPDQNIMGIVCMVIQKNEYGQTYTSQGRLTANGNGSFTVKTMYAEKPTAIKYEYTVNLKNGKWHQTGNHYAIDGKQTLSFDLYMQRVTSSLRLSNQDKPTF